ncbi:hypothetical protein [Methylomonas rosea]|uniref:Uncharacterized protein n=1 Tax=Methylomonas rosea TaxID=2952227 RepID=A0ABT1TVK6_9GAMM|nr:hypothetical protein [Methylomonas sp. WSC-7]MCQ8118797.1 hypothetical protein [Methylomonas sp. WSC-7]
MDFLKFETDLPIYAVVDDDLSIGTAFCCPQQDVSNMKEVRHTQYMKRLI